MHGLIEHYVAGWKAKMQEWQSLALLAQNAVTPQGACVGHAAWGCVVPASLGGSYAGTLEDVGRCFWRGGSSGFAAASFCFPRLSYTVRVQCHGIRRQGLLCSTSGGLIFVRGRPCTGMESCRLLDDDRCTKGAPMERRRRTPGRQRLCLCLHRLRPSRGACWTSRG